MRFEIYQDGVGEFRWRMKAANGKIVADSGEGYTRKRDCEIAVRSFRGEVYSAPIVDMV